MQAAAHQAEGAGAVRGRVEIIHTEARHAAEAVAAISANALLYRQCPSTADYGLDVRERIVHRHRRGRGAGRALLQAALDWARRHDMQRVRLGVTIQDSPAMHLYTALGFKPIGPPEPLRAGSALMSQGMELVLDTVQARND